MVVSVCLECGRGDGCDCVPNETRSILGSLVLEDNQCIVALDESGDGHIIAQSDWLQEHDVLLERTTEECNFTPIGWDNDLTVGLYLMRVKAWANGEDDGGVDVLSCTPLWAAPEGIQASFEGEDPTLDKKVKSQHDIDWTPAETMLFLLNARKHRNWKVEDVPGASKRVLVRFPDGDEWYHLCRTDLMDNIVVYGNPIGLPSQGEKYWDDPLAYYARQYSFGARLYKGPGELPVIAVITHYSDG